MTRASGAIRASRPSRDSVSPSAQWRSSATSNNGRVALSRRRKATTAVCSW